MTSDHPLEESQEQAALYALGALSVEETAAFETHLRGGCSVCVRELESFRAVVGELATAVEPRVPDARLRGEVMERFKEAVIQLGGLQFVFGGELPWTPALPGIEAKRLFSDDRRGYHTQLVRMAAGASYPRHRHTEPEEIFVVEGDLSVSGVGMRAGDYCRAEPGTLHEGISTQGGCTILVLSSEHDEILV